MKVIIQCAGSKSKNAESFSLENGSRILFVANPTAATPQGGVTYARPDDVAEAGRESWRDRLVAYNKNESAKNPFNLLPAYKLYTNHAYEHLVSKFDKNKVFILSAGWGLIPASFLTPTYDITFSSSGDALNRRKPRDRYKDFCMMDDDDERMVFLGGKSYLPLFHALTEKFSGQRTVFYNSLTPPGRLLPNVRMLKFETRKRTNWHYECAHALCEGKVSI